MKIKDLYYLQEKEMIRDYVNGTIRRKMEPDYYFTLNEMFNEIANSGKIMIRVENYKNNKYVVKELEVPQKFYDVYYVFAYILNNEDVRTMFNKKDKDFFEKLKDPNQEITEQMLTEANLQILVLIGNDSINIGLEIVGLELNFISNGNYINLASIEDVQKIWKSSLMNIVKAPTKIGGIEK